MTVSQTAVMVGAMALATVLTRALPFFVFPQNRQTPKMVLYLGKVLPFAITGMLIIFCLKDTSVAAAPHGIPELIGVGTVVLVYLTGKRSLLAIIAGTLVYMLAVQGGWFL